MLHPDEKELDTHGASNTLGAWLDANARSDADFEKYEAEFTDPAFVARLEQAIDIATKFFGYRPDYVVYRGNRGKPFVTLKYHHPTFPNHLKPAAKEALFYAPLRPLGSELRPSRQGYTIRVRC